MSLAWYVVTVTGEKGPFSAGQLRRLASEGKIKPSTRVRREDRGEAVPAAKVRGLFPEGSITAHERPTATQSGATTSSPARGVRRYKWELSAQDTVSLDVTWFGKKTVYLNGREVQRLGRKGGKPFRLFDGRAAQIAWKKPFIGKPVPHLTVNSELAVMTTANTRTTCDNCNTPVRPYNRFCDNCGKALPSATDQQSEKHVNEATGAIGCLGVLFAVYGVVMYFLQRPEAEDALARLEGLAPDTPYAELTNGRTMTVAELRAEILWESTGVLVVNLVLAAIMAGLIFWAKRSPLPAILVAAATYAVVLVLGVIMDPATIAEGLIMKIIIIGCLYRGIRAGLELRTRHG